MLYKLTTDIEIEAQDDGSFILSVGDHSWQVSQKVFMETIGVFIAPTDLDDAVEIAPDDAKELLADMAANGGLVPVVLPRPAHRSDSYALAVNPECAQLVVYFSGTLAFPNQKIDVFQAARVYEIGDRNFMIIRDASAQQYRQGVSEDIPDFASVIQWLKGVIDGMPWVEEVHFIGMSAGAVCATIAGHTLGVDSVVALGLVKTRDVLGIALNDGIQWDLEELLATHNGKTRYDLYYGTRHERDRRSAETLEGLGGVQLIGLDTDDHDVATVLNRAGEISRLLPQYRDSSREKTWRPPEELAQPKRWNTREVAIGVNVGALDRFPDTPAHVAFEEIATTLPDRTAVRSTAGNWTYAELNARANQIARALVARGAGPTTPVGVAVQRTRELVAALLGVMKSGAYYVALDPAVPQQRLEMMATDAGVEFILCDEAGRRLFGDYPDDSVVDVNCSGEASNLDRSVSPEHLAYVLYTSGTTGRPKGVMVPHRAVMNHATTFAQHVCDLRVDAGRRRSFALKSSYGFDLFVSEFFPPLTFGASVAIVPEGVERRADELIELLDRLQVTDLWSTPTLLRILSADHDFSGGSLRYVYSAGEALRPELAETIKRRWGVTIWNLYGVTEMCAGQTGWQSADESFDVAPIGRAVPNHSIATLGDRWDVVESPNVSGQIAIAGVGEAWGYLGDPRKTALAFVPAFGQAGAGARMYLSGDLAHWKENGNLVYEGRRDNQLQVRGVRVELTELEAHLVSMPHIAEAVVIAIDVVEGRTDELRAYVRAVPGSNPNLDEVKSALAERVAETVLPSRILLVESFPTNSSGKVDRSALELLGEEDPEFSGTLPRTPLEEDVARIWCDILQRSAIGVDENFFEIGGTSVLVAVVRREMDDELGVNVPDRLFFDRGTVEEVAKYIALFH